MRILIAEPRCTPNWSTGADASTDNNSRAGVALCVGLPDMNCQKQQLLQTAHKSTADLISLLQLQTKTGLQQAKSVPGQGVLVKGLELGRAVCLQYCLKRSHCCTPDARCRSAAPSLIASPPALTLHGVKGIFANVAVIHID